MKKMDILALLESEHKSLVKNISAKNSNKIIGLFESSGLLKKGESTETEAPSRSKRPDIAEMDATSRGGVYDVSAKDNTIKAKTAPKNTQQPKPDNKNESEPKPETPPADTQEQPKTGIIPKKSDNKQTEEPKPESEQTESSKNGIVDKSSGYSEIQLTEDLKDVDEKELDNTLSKKEIDSILTANNDAKSEVFRNLLFIKKSDFGGSGEYECFTTGKGGTKMVKGMVPDTYLSKYYASKSEIVRPDTKEPYLVFSAKSKGSEEQLKSMTLPDNASKYIVFTSESNNNSEYITVLDESEFDLLFHQVRND